MQEKSQYSGREKRKYPRFDVVAKIQFKKIQETSEHKEAFVKDVSAEGFCFSSSQEFKPGEILEVDIAEEKAEKIGEGSICVRAQVIWCDKAVASKEWRDKESFLTGVKVLGIRKSDEARFAMLYCERMLAELKFFLRM